MSEEIGEILVQADDLQHRIRAMAEEIARDYEGKDLLLIGVLKGAFLFLADLMRHLDVGCEVDFMAVASYGSSTESSGVVRILKDLDAPLEGRHVLIVEDIVDSGLTLQYLMRTLKGRGPASLDRPVTITVAPPWPSARAMPRPSPREAPATRQTLPVSGFSGLSSFIATSLASGLARCDRLR